MKNRNVYLGNMRLEEFLGLEEAEQWEEFWANCSFIEHYQGIDFKNHLYALHKFYVELTTDAKEKMVPSMNVFSYGPRLEKYLVNFK